MPTSYRLIIEPRKGKPQPLGEGRAPADTPAREAGEPVVLVQEAAATAHEPLDPVREPAPAGRDLAITIPSMRAVSAKVLASPASDSDRPPPSSAPTPVPAPLAFGGYAAGQVLVERYRLIEPVGLGGMGAVWRARSLPLDLEVAVKLLRRDTVIPDARERLVREARLAARVAHPAAVRVLDSATTEQGDPFLVMELLRGRSLSKTLAERGPIGAVVAVQLMLPVIEALSVAHAQGMVHRDVKPSNILLLDNHPTPKLIDFGIACAAQSGPTRRLTAMDFAIGSPDYMAPEQLRRGAPPDLRSDVWGICATLYESVSGVRLATTMTGESPLSNAKSGRSPVAGVFEEHSRFWAIIARGVASAVEARWPTMIALGSVLAEWALSTGVTCDVSGKALSAYCATAAAAMAPELTSMAARLELAALYRAQKRDAEATVLLADIERDWAGTGPGARGRGRIPR